MADNSQCSTGAIPTQSCLNSSWRGTRTGTNGNSGNLISSVNAVELGTEHDLQRGAYRRRAIIVALRSDPQTIPVSASANLLDYNTSIGGGTQHVWIGYEQPSMSAGQVIFASSPFASLRYLRPLEPLMI